MMGRAKRIYIFMIKDNKLFSFFSSRCFLKEIENMYSVFLSSYTNTHGSLGELEKVHSISRSPKLPLDRITVHVFYFLNTIWYLLWATYIFDILLWSQQNAYLYNQTASVFINCQEILGIVSKMNGERISHSIIFMFEDEGCTLK